MNARSLKNDSTFGESRILKCSLIYYSDVEGREVFKVPSRVWIAGQEGEMLREHPADQDRPRLQHLRCQPQVPGGGGGGWGGGKLPRDSTLPDRPGGSSLCSGHWTRPTCPGGEV